MLKIRILGCMFSQILYACLTRDGWKRTHRLLKIVKLTLTLFPTPHGGFSSFGDFSTPTSSSATCSFFHHCLFIAHVLFNAFNPTSIFNRSKLSLIVQSQRLVGRFLHSLKVLMTYFLWHLVVDTLTLVVFPS